MKITIGTEHGGIYGTKIVNYFITQLCPDAIIEYKNTPDCNFIIRSVFRHKNNIWNTNNRKHKYINFSGESYIPKQSQHSLENLYIITTVRTDLINNIYVPYVLFSPHLYKSRISINIDRPYLLAYCNSNAVTEREDMFNLFVEKTSSDVCHSLGKNYGKYKSTQQKKTGGGWGGDELIESYQKYKFVIAMENKRVDGYVTEKILNAFYSGAVPVYWGSDNINDFFNKKAFINVSDYETFEQCVDYVVNMDDETRLQMVNEPIYNPDNDLIHLMDSEYNTKNENKVLKRYLDKFSHFLTH